MSDQTGHMDRPGAGPLNSANISMSGIPTNHYWHHNPETGRYEVVRSMPAGTPDVVVREFGSFADLQAWVNDEWMRTGRLS
jgi:hypothetical protein